MASVADSGNAQRSGLFIERVQLGLFA